MIRTKRTYSSEFKQEAVILWQTTGKTTTSVEQDMGITSGLLNKWKNKRAIVISICLLLLLGTIISPAAVLRAQTDPSVRFIRLSGRDGLSDTTAYEKDKSRLLRQPAR